MKTYIVLFRGINVGGNNILPMKELVSLLKQHQFESVSSYIQTGNIVLKFKSDPQTKLEQLVNEHYDFKPQTFVLTDEAFLQAKSQNPYVNSEGKFVHFYFCKNTDKINLAKLAELKIDSEEYQVINNVLYLHAPDGIGRSKLAAKIETCIGAPTTARNLNTINKIATMLANS